MVKLGLIYAFFILWPWFSLTLAKKLFTGPNPRKGESLSLQIRNLMLDHGRGSELASYKFYTMLVQNLLDYRHQYGHSPKESWKKLRQNLERDIKFEKKLKKELSASFTQMILIVLVTWGFIFITTQVTKMKLQVSHAFPILLLQSIGLILYGLIFKFLKQKKLFFYEHYFFVLYKLQALVQIGTSPGEALTSARVSELFELEKLPTIGRRLKEGLSSWRTYGSPIQDELSYILDEVWDSLERSFDSLMGHNLILRFIIIVGFFLSAYFSYLLTLFGQVFVF